MKITNTEIARVTTVDFDIEDVEPHLIEYRVMPLRPKRVQVRVFGNGSVTVQFGGYWVKKDGTDSANTGTHRLFSSERDNWPAWIKELVSLAQVMATLDKIPTNPET